LASKVEATPDEQRRLASEKRRVPRETRIEDAADGEGERAEGEDGGCSETGKENGTNERRQTEKGG